MPSEMAALSSTQTSAHQRPALLRALDLVLTTDPRQRRCLTVLLLASLVTAIAIALVTVGAMLGVFDPRGVLLLAVLSAGTMLSFFVMIRSGWNQRCADPTLAYPQTIAAQSLVACAYSVLGPLHSTTLIMLALVMVFGMFNMRADAVRAACVYAVVAMGAVMYWRSHADPVQYHPLLEFFNFILVVTVMAAISQLTGQLMAMRQRLKTQRAALQHALAQIRELATRDELTGLPNRRHMLDMLNAHAQRRARGGQRFYVGLIDLDHFKTINDRYGHAAGDEALRVFAEQAQAVLRATDAIGRWGGEEFLLILPENGPADPTVCVERLRSALASTCVPGAAPEVRVRFSAGVTRFRDGEAIGQAVERADHALYTAKSEGRGRTVLL